MRRYLALAAVSLLFISSTPFLASGAETGVVLEKFPTERGWVSPTPTPAPSQFNSHHFGKCDLVDRGDGGSFYLLNYAHLGADSSAYRTGKVVTIASGRVLEKVAWVFQNQNVGQALTVLHKTHSGIYFVALYGHLDIDSKIEVGSEIEAGIPIGTVHAWPDNPDNSHTHFGITPLESKEFDSAIKKGKKIFTDGVVKCTSNPISSSQGNVDPLNWLEGQTPAQEGWMDTSTPTSKTSTSPKPLSLQALKKAATDKVVKVAGSSVSYFYNGTLHWIPDSETYYCFTDGKKKQVYQVASQAIVNSLGNGKPWVKACIDPTRAIGKIIRVDSNKDSFTYDGKLHSINDASTYVCLQKKGMEVLNVDTQAHVDSLGKVDDMPAQCSASSTAPSPAVMPTPTPSPAVMPTPTPSPAVMPTPTPVPTKPAINSILIDPCLDLRASADGGSALLDCIPKGTIITISCTATGNSVSGPYGASTIWDKTTWDGITGYVSDAYVYTGISGPAAGACFAPTPVATPTLIPTSTGVGRIIASPCLNFRGGPNGTSASIGCIPNGTMITIICTATGNSVSGPYGATTLWDKTTWNGITGYVSDAYVYTGTANAVAGMCTS